MADTNNRRRTHQWPDPDQLARDTRSLSGRDFLRAWKDGRLTAPMAETLQFDLIDFGEGRVVISCTPAEFHYNPYGSVHGGLAATLLDTATGCAIQTLLPAGTGYATLSLNVSYLRPITTGSGALLCEGRVSHHGRRVAVAEAELRDGQGQSVARATSTCLVIGSEKPAPTPGRTDV